LDAFVEQVGEVLGRAHSLFGEPPTSGRSLALTSGSELAGAGNLVRGGISQVSALSGEFADNYATFGDQVASDLYGLAGSDDRLGDRLREAAHTDRTGNVVSGRILNGAAADTATLASYTDTPAGQRALIAALRNRLTRQQAVIVAYKRRDAALAAMVRSVMRSARVSGAAGIPVSRGGFAAPLFGAPMIRPSPPRPTCGSARPGSPRSEGDTDATLTARVDHRAEGLPSGPGGEAAAAALSKQGTPYVWGAKGPNRFDCSGLTQWAWAQAGVHLGPDTYSQIAQGVPVAPGQVRAGDLIFPEYAWDDRGPGHVQLAISSTEVVHAPQTGDVVRIAPMPGSYIARRPVPVFQNAEN
jgi:cell wall-associated NlpC family hydrolase